MNDIENILVEGLVKYRDGKKWKSRWYIMKKMSPAADSLKLLLYKTYKDRLRRIPNSNGQHFRTHNATIKHEIILKNILAIENGFTYDKESNTIGIIHENGEQFVILSFDSRENLIQFQVKLYSSGIYDGISYRLLLRTLPPKSKIPQGPCKIHIQNYKFSLTTGVPPKLEHVWEITYLRRYGIIENSTRLCFEGGSKCGSRGQGIFIFLTENGPEIVEILKLASQGLFKKDKFLTEKSSDRDNTIIMRGRKSSKFPKSFSSLYIPRKSFSPMRFESNMTRSWTMVSSSQEKISCHSTNESESFNYDKPKPLIRSLYSENYDVPKKLQPQPPRLNDSGYQSLNTSLECDECGYELKLQNFESKTLGRLKQINKKFVKRSTSVDLLEDPMDKLTAEFQKSKMNDYVEMQNSFLHKIKFKF